MMINSFVDNMLDISNSTYDIDTLYDKILDYSTNELNFVYLGRHSYQPMWILQKKIHEAVKNSKSGSVVLFLEHEHVYTFGKNADRDFLLNSYPKNVEVVNTDRGGEITYHGPGQLIGYPIINLNYFTKSVTWYMRSLENIIINTLQDFNIHANSKDKMTGVWVNDEKICAMGVRLSRWVTMHGFALNLKPNMTFYDSMIPCGIQEYGVTSIYDLISKKVDLVDISIKIANNFIKIFKEVHEKV